MANVPLIQRSDEVESVAQILLAKYHAHLAEANVLYLFTDATRKKCDRVRLGSAAKMGSLQRFLSSGNESVLSGPDFLMLIDSNIWPMLTEPQQRALVDHELCHMSVQVKNGEEGWIRLPENADKGDFAEWKYSIRGHDLEEFNEILERHGFWRDDEAERKVKKVVLQMPLPALSSREMIPAG